MTLTVNGIRILELRNRGKGVEQTRPGVAARVLVSWAQSDLLSSDKGAIHT